MAARHKPCSSLASDQGVKAPGPFVCNYHRVPCLTVCNNGYLYSYSKYNDQPQLSHNILGYNHRLSGLHITSVSVPGQSDPCNPPVYCTVGEYLAYPDDCTKYLFCTSPFRNGWLLQNCAPGLYFNPDIGLCDFIQNCLPPCPINTGPTVTETTLEPSWFTLYNI